MLFHRDFLGYTGGHGKVWNYFNHALALGWDARVYLTPASLRDASNPWLSMPDRIETQWRPEAAELLFLGGVDWLALEGRDTASLPPVVNLVQHVRHADSAQPLRAFLRRPAWRICVAQAVADAITATGEVAGEVRVIPAALDIDVPMEGAKAARRGLFIGALKGPALGRALAARLASAGYEVRLEDALLPRADYLAALASAEAAVLLPHPTEGFYLPGLEAMALGCPVVMPPCVGSGQYARDGVNCLMPSADVEALAEAVTSLADAVLRERLCGAGLETARGHGLPAERDAFAALLREMER